MSRPKQRSLVMTVGGDLMGLPQIANEALAESQYFSGDPDKVAWDIFMYILDRDDLVDEAFENAWPKNGVVPFALSKGLSLQDAEDISQKTARMVWQQFTQFKPYIASWNTWILMIAERQIAKFWRDTEKEKENQGLESVTIEQGTVEIDRPGWSVPAVCRKWIESEDPDRAQFASVILAVYYNFEWIPPTSSQMARAIGISRSKCHRLFNWFARDVIYMEMIK